MLPIRGATLLPPMVMIACRCGAGRMAECHA
jgi:hypothetical protein